MVSVWFFCQIGYTGGGALCALPATPFIQAGSQIFPHLIPKTQQTDIFSIHLTPQKE